MGWGALVRQVRLHPLTESKRMQLNGTGYRMIWLFRYIIPILPSWLFDRLTLSLSPVNHVKTPGRPKVD